MKYQEIEKWFDRFLIDELHFRGEIKLVITCESEMLNALETYVEQLLSQGYELKEEIYTLCLKHFGKEFQDIIDIFFEYED